MLRLIFHSPAKKMAGAECARHLDTTMSSRRDLTAADVVDHLHIRSVWNLHLRIAALVDDIVVDPYGEHPEGE